MTSESWTDRDAADMMASPVEAVSIRWLRGGLTVGLGAFSDVAACFRVTLEVGTGAGFFAGAVFLAGAGCLAGTAGFLATVAMGCSAAAGTKCPEAGGGSSGSEDSDDPSESSITDLEIT